MMQDKQEYYVPPGVYKLLTQQEYVDEWWEFINKLTAKLGDHVACTGFNPQISLALEAKGELVSGATVQIPLWFAVKIINEEEAL